jgi:hypothetical protein
MEINKRAYENGIIKNQYSFYPSVIAGLIEKVTDSKDLSRISKAGLIKSYERGLNDDETTLDVELDPVTKELKFTIAKHYQSDLSRPFDAISESILNKIADISNQEFYEYQKVYDIFTIYKKIGLSPEEINYLNNLNIPKVDGYYRIFDIRNALKTYDDYSFNLLKSYAIFVNHMEEYIARSESEELANILLDIEKDKSNIATDARGLIKYEIDFNNQKKPIINKGVNENIQLLREMINFTIYGRNELTTSSFKQREV